mmetsp:Transcript_36133/g.67289  ORF Transcript_36133/g.67289 Transcript_36133/m.67289 type:complete len:200 (-) Transcript_36133:277-876(-)
MSALMKLLMSWARKLTSSDILTLPLTAGTIFAKALMSRSRSLVLMASSADTRSSLFNSSLSQNATCWYASFTRPSSTSSSRRLHTFLASATVMTPSSRSLELISSEVMNVRTIGTGSAMPVVSITIWSRCLPFSTSFRISLKPSMRSPRIVQHMQPLSMTTTFSAKAILSFFKSRSSMDTSPNSFSMTAIFFSLCSCRM